MTSPPSNPSGPPLPAELADFLGSEEGSLFREDLIAWSRWFRARPWFPKEDLPAEPLAPDGLTWHFQVLFRQLPEFRSLLDFRLPAGHKFKQWRKETHPRPSELHIWCASIGPRFIIQHGQNTVVLAKEIGSDFSVQHNVTIGNHKGVPTIGDRVTIHTGAVVVGDIVLGDDAIVGANALVVESVPAGHGAYAPRAIIKPRQP